MLALMHPIPSHPIPKPVLPSTHSNVQIHHAQPRIQLNNETSTGGLPQDGDQPSFLSESHGTGRRETRDPLKPKPLLQRALSFLGLRVDGVVERIRVFEEGFVAAEFPVVGGYVVSLIFLFYFLFFFYFPSVLLLPFFLSFFCRPLSFCSGLTRRITDGAD